jgi:serine/threonine-protein kinase
VTAESGGREGDRISALQRADRIGTRAGEYEITGVLGKGGMGTVYSGIHPIIGTKVAIKVLDPRLAEPSVIARFMQEARAVNKIRHPNIIEIFAFGESPDLGHYFVMPLLEGDTLAARIQTGGPLAPAAALSVLAQIAEALDAAHAAGVYHRDLKPENVVLADDGRGHEVAKVLDFGLAKLTDATSVAVTSEKFSMGTPLYMSPEQWAAVANVDHRTDVYALGVVLHFMLTGRHPFEGSSPVALMRLHTGAPPVPASQHGAPAAADPVIAKALAKDRDERFQRPSELSAAFAAAFAGDAVDPLAVTTGAGKRRMSAAMAVTEHAATTGTAPRRRRRALLLGAVVAAAALLVAGGFFLSRGDGRRDAREPAAAHPRPAATAAPADRVPPAGAAPDAGPAAADAGVAERVTRPAKRRRDRRPPDARRPRRRDVHSTWGKTDDPF